MVKYVSASGLAEFDRYKYEWSVYDLVTGHYSQSFKNYLDAAEYAADIVGTNPIRIKNNKTGIYYDLSTSGGDEFSLWDIEQMESLFYDNQVFNDYSDN